MQVSTVMDFITEEAPTSSLWALQQFQFIGNLRLFEAHCRSSTIRLMAVSDGSFKDLHGTASWRISIPSSDDYFLCSAISPGSPESQSAYRSELTGLYGIAVTLWAIKCTYKCSIEAEIGCDGLSALSHFQYESDVINPSASHFDLISAIRWLLSEIGGTYRWRHIKGHQDDDENALLDTWAHFNIQMDLEAKKHWSETHTINARERPNRIYGETGVLTINDVKVVVNLKQQLMTYLGSIKAVAHWEDRFNWGRGNGKKIHWEALGVAVQKERLSRRLWIAKFATGFFGSGRMMLRRNKWPHSNCPRCKVPDETAEHIIRCRNPDAMDKWSRHITELEPWLIANHTSSHIAKAICTKLLQWQQDPENCTAVNATLSQEVRSVFEAQDAIGWLCFMYGFWSLEWIGIQQAYLVSLQSKISVKRWSSAIIQKLWLIAWDMWDHRNQILHDKDHGQMVQELNDEVTLLYQGGYDALPRDAHSLFRPALQDVLDSSTANKKMWIARVRAAKARASRRRSIFAGERSIMRRWLHSST